MAASTRAEPFVGERRADVLPPLVSREVAVRDLTGPLLPAIEVEVKQAHPSLVCPRYKRAPVAAEGHAHDVGRLRLALDDLDRRAEGPPPLQVPQDDAGSHVDPRRDASGKPGSYLATISAECD